MVHRIYQVYFRNTLHRSESLAHGIDWRDAHATGCHYVAFIPLQIGTEAAVRHIQLDPFTLLQLSHAFGEITERHDGHGYEILVISGGQAERMP